MARVSFQPSSPQSSRSSFSYSFSPPLFPIFNAARQVTLEGARTTVAGQLLRTATDTNKTSGLKTDFKEEC